MYILALRLSIPNWKLEMPMHSRQKDIPSRKDFIQCRFNRIKNIPVKTVCETRENSVSSLSINRFDSVCVRLFKNKTTESNSD